MRFFQGGMTITELSHRFALSYWTIRNELLAEANGGVLPEQKKGSRINNWRSVAVPL